MDTDTDTDADRARVLVYGANGTRGAAVARALLARGHRVRVVVRDPAASRWRGRDGVQVVAGDLGDRPSLERASDGVDAVAFQLPLVYDRAVAAGFVANAVAAARAGGAGRLVYAGLSLPPAEPTEVVSFEIDRTGAGIARESGIPVTVLRPTIFLENLLGPWTAPGIVNDGVLAYPIAAEAAVSWLATDDMGAAVAAAIERPELAGATIDVGGPAPLTGVQLAEAVSVALGRPVRYQPIPADAFAAGLAAAFGPEVGASIAGSYRWDADRGGARLATDPAPLAALGLRPVSAAEWAARQAWPPASAADQAA